MKSSDRDLFRGWKAPSAPENLAGRVLAVAMSEARCQGRPLLIDRLWESQILRYGWATAVLALVVVNAMVFMPPPSTAHRTEERVVDSIENDPVVLAQLEKGAGPRRLKLAEHKELQNQLLAAGPATDGTIPDWRVDT